MRGIGIIFGVVVAAAAGFGAGFYVGQRKEQDRANKEIAEIRTHYEEKAKKATETVERTPLEAPKMPEKPSLEEIREKHMYTNYARLKEPYEASEGPSKKDDKADTDESKDEEEEEAPVEHVGRDPKLISLDEFGEEEDFEVLDLLYYQDDDLLCDAADNSEITGEERDNLVGTCLVKYDFVGNDETNCYIRNFDQGYDIHVKKISGTSY